MNTIGFIGIGNMGGAMVKAIAERENELEPITIYDVNKEAYQKFLHHKHIIIEENLENLIKRSKYIVLSIKPQYYEVICAQIRDYLKPEQVIITVSPAHSITMMKKLLGKHTKIIRTMPNTPALIGAGVTAYTHQVEVLTENEINRFLELFNSFGKTIYVEEKLMAAVVATTGSSPAYAYIFIEAMADAAVSFGMPRSMAYEMSASALKGACEMVLSTKKHPGELKDAVTSPGGTTIQAVMALEESGFRNSVIKGMSACYHKANQMNKEA